MIPSRPTPEQEKINYLVVGKLRRPHGVHGEILMDVTTDFPERLKPGIVLYVGPQYRPVKLRSARTHGNAMLVAFDEFHTPEEVGELRNQLLYVRSKDRPRLEEGEYYHHQLLNLRVVDEEGQPLGMVSDILETGANDVIVVRPENGPELLLPVTDEVVLDIGLEKGEIRVHILPGLGAE